MVLTPDQKKRIAALDVKASESEEEAKDEVKVSSALQAVSFNLRRIVTKATIGKILILLAVVGAIFFFAIKNQVHRVDFQTVFASGPGTPISRFSQAVKIEKQKAAMLEEGHKHFLGGDYDKAFETGVAVAEIDDDDPRPQTLIDLTADAVTQKATREYESGEIEPALADVRLSLKYRPEHKGANELYMDIAARLLHEAKVHYHKKEYPQLINKAHEVQRIVNDVLKADASNVADSNLMVQTSNLLRQANNELLTHAGELFISKDYFAALQTVRLSMRIDRKNPTAIRLMNQISNYIETPKVKLRGIIKSSGTTYAQIQLPDTRKVVLVKKGDTVRNFKVIDIDAVGKVVELRQIHTGKRFPISQAKIE